MEGDCVISKKGSEKARYVSGGRCGHCLGGQKVQNMQSNEAEGYLSVLKVRVLKGRKSRVAGKYQYPGEF